MKKTRRLSIEVQHREVTATLEGWFEVRDEPETGVSPEVCLRCGGRWIAVVARGDGADAARMNRIRCALEHFGSHLQVSTAGELRICQRSLEELKEKL